MSGSFYNGARLPSGPFGTDVGLRLKRTRENQVVLNAMPDDTHRAILKKNMEKRPQHVFYCDEQTKRPIAPPGKLAEELDKLYDWEIVVVPTNGSSPDRRSEQGGGGPYNLDQTRVSVLSVLNGVIANSRAAIQRNYRPLGLMELGNRDNPKIPGGRVIVGGIVPAPNRTTVPFLTGDALFAVPPTVAELDELQSCIEGNIADVSGRVTEVLVPGRVLTMFDRDDVRNAIVQEFALADDGNPVLRNTGAKKTWAHDPKDEGLVRLNRTDADEDFALAVVEMIKAQATVIGSGQNLNAALKGNPVAFVPEPLRISEAVLFAVASTFYLKGASKPDPKAVDNYCKRFSCNDPAAGDLFADAIKKILGTAAVAEQIFGENPWEAMVRAVIQYSLTVRKNFMGVCTVGAQPGEAGEMHLSSYMK